MTGFMVLLLVSVLALAFGGTVLEQRVNALKREVDELRKQIRADSEAEEAKKPTCQGCKYLGYWNSGEPFCTKGVDKACISSGFKFRVEVNNE